MRRIQQRKRQYYNRGYVLYCMRVKVKDLNRSEKDFFDFGSIGNREKRKAKSRRER